MKAISYAVSVIIAALLLAGCNSSESVQVSAKPSPNALSSDLALAEKAGAPLFEGMGEYEMPITTEEPNAQRYFNQGMVLAFAFNHAESIRSFRAAQTLDPTCAMCFGAKPWRQGQILMSPVRVR